MTSRKKVNTKLVRVLIIIVAVAGLSVAAFLFISNTYFSEDKNEPKTGENYKELSTKISGSKDASVESIVKDYGQKYDDVVEGLQKTEVDKWDSEANDKAHFGLIYADRIGDYSQAESFYYQINAAKENGIDVDSNAAGLNQADRDEIMNRAPKVEYLQGVGSE